MAMDSSFLDSLDFVASQEHNLTSKTARPYLNYNVYLQTWDLHISQ